MAILIDSAADIAAAALLFGVPMILGGALAEGYRALKCVKRFIAARKVRAETMGGGGNTPPSLPIQSPQVSLD